MNEEGEKYTFSYQHFRPIAGEEPAEDGYRCERYMRGVTKWTPHERGGATLCHVYNDGNLIAWGLAFCSMKDGFSYRLGREVSRGRAIAWLNGGKMKIFNGYTLNGWYGHYYAAMPEEFYVPA